MENSTKQMIARSAREYIARHGLSQSAFSRMAGVGQSYLSNILNSNFSYRASGSRSVPIADKYFLSIARVTGAGKGKTEWPVVETPQMIQMISALEEAKERGSTKMIIGDPGCGKTMTAARFCSANPVNTFRITVSNLHNISDILDDLAAAAGIQATGRKASRLRTLTDYMRELHLQGGRPLIIVDEGENLKPATLGLCKTVYDAISESCGFVIIGTSELQSKLDRMDRLCTPGVKQFRRRFKAGTVILQRITRQMMEKFLGGVEDAALRKLLLALCSNYGELHDYLVPAMEAAREDGGQLSEGFFRKIYYLNKAV